MTKTPTISVITPAFNREKTLARAIESVLKQSFKDFEYILVNDASTESTLQIMEKYREHDPRIRIVKNENRSRGGPIEWEPRNDALRLARGNYIAYLDSDNEWRTQFLEKLTTMILDDPELQIVHCDSQNFYPSGTVERIKKSDPRTLVDSGPDWTVFSYNDLNPALFGREIFIDTNEILHRATVFKKLGSLWHTEHPRRAKITTYEPVDRPQRRHNDMDLVERIVGAFGTNALAHLKEVLVDFYYEGATRDLSTNAKTVL